MNGINDPVDVEKSLRFARDAGFSRLNIDLIFAIPGQTMQSWQSSLERAIALGTSHISCYALTYETNTAITVRKRLGILLRWMMTPNLRCCITRVIDWRRLANPLMKSAISPNRVNRVGIM